MQNQFSFERFKEGEYRVLHSPTGYDLIIRPEQNAEFHRLKFEVPSEGGRYTSERAGVGKVFKITGRNLVEYNCFPRHHSFKQGLQYLEVGSGFGELIPAVVRAQGGNGPRPVAIDPANYELALEMLDFASNQKLPEGILAKMAEFSERGRILLDSDKVNLIRKPLNIALIDHPELLHSADVVVDCFGVKHYAYEPARIAEVNRTLRQLAKEGDMRRVFSSEGNVLW